MRFLAAIQPLWTPEESERHHREEEAWLAEAEHFPQASPALQVLEPVYREVEAADELHATKAVRDWWSTHGPRVGSILPRDIEVSLIPVTAHTTIRFSVIGSIEGEADIH